MRSLQHDRQCAVRALQPSAPHSCTLHMRDGARLECKFLVYAVRDVSLSTAASMAEAGRLVNACNAVQSGSDAMEITASQAHFRSIP
jgi:hypothetical protein